LATCSRPPPRHTHLKYVLDAEGNPVPEPDHLTWERWFEHDENRVLKQDNISGDIMVSTVFLGVDQHFRNHGPPILWETKVFGGPHDGYREKYSSRMAHVPYCRRCHRKANLVCCHNLALFLHQARLEGRP
jgi:hypothetical protein